MIKKCSFDFDGTLAHVKEVQNYCKELLLNKDIEVHIVTRRYSEEISKLDKSEQPTSDWWKMCGSANWEEVYELANNLGIERKNIHFCNMEDKVLFFIDNPGFIWHLDDDLSELDIMNEFMMSEVIDVMGIPIKYHDWKEVCNRLLI